MKFAEFMADLFGKAAEGGKESTRFIKHSGRPDNVGPDGRVFKHPGVVVKSNYAPHSTHQQHVKKNKSLLVQTMLHRGVPLSVFNARKGDVARKAAGRYVW